MNGLKSHSIPYIRQYIEDIRDIDIVLLNNFKKEDTILKALCEGVGFSGLPTVANKLDENKDTYYRGLSGALAKEYVEQYKYGEYFAGLGIAGNGIYVTKHESDATNFAHNGLIIKMQLASDFKFVSMKDIWIEYKIYKDKSESIINDWFYEAKQKSDDREYYRNIEKKLWQYNRNESIILGDISRFALMARYDGIMLTNKVRAIILNRTKTIVEEN